MASRPVKIGIFGNFGIGNFGNEATLEAMLNSLKAWRSDVELTCICTEPENVSPLHGMEMLPLKWSGPSLVRKVANVLFAFQTMRKLDVLIIPGTGILNDFSAPPFGLPYTVFRWCLAARICGAKLAFVSVGAGPLHHPLTRWFVKQAASMAQYRSYRNKYSKEFMKSLGLASDNDPIYPDLAFALPVRLSSDVRGDQSKPLTVCVGAMLYHGWRGHLRADDSIYEGYIGKLAKFVLWLLDQNCCVRLVMGDERDQKAVDDLRGAILAQRPEIPENTLIAAPASSYQDAIREMSGADIVISSRFHNLIFAMMLGKLTISTGYSDYHTELMDDMGLGRFCQHTEGLDIERLIAQFTELMSNREHYEALIRDAAHSAREALADQEVLFRSSFLKGW